MMTVNGVRDDRGFEPSVLFLACIQRSGMSDSVSILFGSNVQFFFLHYELMSVNDECVNVDCE